MKSDSTLQTEFCLSSLCIHQIYLTVFHSFTKQLYNSNLHLRARYKIQVTIMKLLLCIHISQNNIIVATYNSPSFTCHSHVKVLTHYGINLLMLYIW